MIDHAEARKLTVTAGFTLGGQSFLADMQGGDMKVRRAEPGEGEINFAAAVALPLLRVFYGNQPIEEAERTGDVTVSGDRAVARRFVALFALPEKIAAPSSSAERPA
jgi:hypothetical protein